MSSETPDDATPTLFLASTSPRRRQLLTAAGIPFERFAVSIDEEGMTAAYTAPLDTLGEYLAREKARATAVALHANGRDGLVLASDTTVLLAGEHLAKPGDTDEARTMLDRLRGREHLVATGVALCRTDGAAMASATSVTRVLMRDYGEEEVASYVATGDPLDKAGSYSIQHPDFQPVARITGCYLGVMGLPTCLVVALLTGRPALGETDAHACPWSASCTQPFPRRHSGATANR